MDQVVKSVEVQEPVIESKPQDPIGDLVPHNSMYEMFSAEKCLRTEEAFKLIWKYATEQAQNKDLGSIKLEVVRLKNRLGSPHIGEPSYSKLERYVSAYYDLKKAESRLAEVS